MFNFGKKKGPVLGLDINSDSITLVQLEKTRAGIEVARFACQPTPANAIREGLIAEPELIGNVVLDLMASAGIPPSGASPIVNIAVPAQAVVIRLMPVPVGMPPEELADVVTQEATNHVPFPIEDANLDWSQMPATERTDSDGVRRVDVIIAAIQRSIIESYWRMADSAGVKLGRVDISSLSVVRSLALAGYLGSSGHLSMIVNLRHDATDINVVRSAMPLFGRSIILGMDTLIEAISRSLDIDFNESLDLLPEISLFNVDPRDPRMGHAAQVARTVFGDITDELHRSLEFYKSQVGDVKVDQIILTGPGCMIPQLDQFIFTRMNIKTIISDPMRDLVVEPDVVVETMRPILAALIGTSIEPSWNPSFTVDLDLNKEGRLPLLYDERKTTAIDEITEPPNRWFKPIAIAVCALLLISLGAWAYINSVDLPGKQKQIDELELKAKQADLELKKLAVVKQGNATLTTKKKILDDIMKKTNHWSVVLDSIRHDIPTGVHVDSMSLGNEVKIQGTAVDFSNISNFVLNLSEAPGLSTAAVDFATREEKHPEIISYQITAKMDAAANNQSAQTSLKTSAGRSGKNKLLSSSSLPTSALEASGAP